MPGLPIIVATVWGVFAVPGDRICSGKAPVPVPGFIRLLLELMIFAGGVAALIASGRMIVGIVLAAAVLVHYSLSYDRVYWLLKNGGSADKN